MAQSCSVPRRAVKPKARHVFCITHHDTSDVLIDERRRSVHLQLFEQVNSKQQRLRCIRKLLFTRSRFSAPASNRLHHGSHSYAVAGEAVGIPGTLLSRLFMLEQHPAGRDALLPSSLSRRMIARCVSDITLPCLPPSQRHQPHSHHTSMLR